MYVYIDIISRVVLDLGESRLQTAALWYSRRVCLRDVASSRDMVCMNNMKFVYRYSPELRKASAAIASPHNSRAASKNIAYIDVYIYTYAHTHTHIYIHI